MRTIVPASLTLIATLIACQGRPLAPAPALAEPAPALPRGPVAAPTPPVAGPTPRSRAEGAVDDGEGDGWIETARYGLRLSGAKGCGPRPASGRMWVGVDARVRTKDGDLFVTARDFSLENGGVILLPRHIDRPLLPGCFPLLSPSALRAKQSVRGFVLFEMPVAWTSGRDPIVLAYRPTRWGGARRIEARIPPCLDACADTPSTSRRSNKSRVALRR